MCTALFIYSNVFSFILSETVTKHLEKSWPDLSPNYLKSSFEDLKLNK